MKDFKPKERDHVIADAAVEASRYLSEQGVAHCLVGRLGVLSHGYDCEAPTHVTFLIDADVAFTSAGHGIVATKASLPLSVGNIRVKWSTFEKSWEHATWAHELALSMDDEVPVAPIDLLLYLLMVDDDESSVRAAVANGAPFVSISETLKAHEPAIGAKFEDIVEVALP